MQSNCPERATRAPLEACAASRGPQEALGSSQARRGWGPIVRLGRPLQVPDTFLSPEGKPAGCRLSSLMAMPWSGGSPSWGGPPEELSEGGPVPGGEGEVYRSLAQLRDRRTAPESAPPARCLSLKGYRREAGSRVGQARGCPSCAAARRRALSSCAAEGPPCDHGWWLHGPHHWIAGRAPRLLEEYRSRVLFFGIASEGPLRPDESARFLPPQA